MQVVVDQILQSNKPPSINPVNHYKLSKIRIICQMCFKMQHTAFSRCVQSVCSTKSDFDVFCFLRPRTRTKISKETTAF